MQFACRCCARASRIARSISGWRRRSRRGNAYECGQFGTAGSRREPPPFAFGTFPRKRGKGRSRNLAAEILPPRSGGRWRQPNGGRRVSGELIFGIHAVESALTHDPKNIIELYIEVDSQNARLKELSERARDAGVKPHARDRAALDRMTGGARHQGAVARYRAPPPRAESELYALVEKAEKET